MATLILDRRVERALIDDRRARGLDRWDEVWEGTYVVLPLPNNEHQWLVGRLVRILQESIEDVGLGRVFPGCNVSDRAHGWEHNYRCPDVAVYLRENPAVDYGTHWEGGPDLAIEIVSPDDRTYEKLDFYASIGTRELLIVDRDPWRLQFFRNVGGALVPAPADQPVITSTVGLRWALTAVPDGALRLELQEIASGRQWSVTG